MFTASPNGCLEVGAFPQRCVISITDHLVT